MDERMYLFLATDLTAGPPNLEQGEEIENLVVPMHQAKQMVGSGEIQDGKTLTGLMWYWQFYRPVT
jgi:ADP-ribose pyrophosphatase